jgi:acyl-CoA synthetase (AMP-forming)/AMP-acid ligase II
VYSSLINYRALTQPKAIALIDAGGPVSYRQFDRAINQVATALLALAPEQPALVGVDMRDLEHHWLVMLALARLGHATFTAPASESAVAATGAKLVLTDRDDRWDTAAYAVQLDAQWWSDALAADVPPVRERGHWDAPARLMITSGTTGSGKMVMLTHRVVARRVQQELLVQRPEQNTETARQLVTMGPGTAGGFIAPLLMWARGGAIVIPTSRNVTQEVLNPVVTAAVISTGQLQDILRSLPADFAPRPQLTIMTGGSRMSRELEEEATRRLTPAIYSIYGSTEAGSVAGAPLRAIRIDAGDVGIVYPLSHVEIVDDQDVAVAPGTPGIVRLWSESLVGEYFGDAEATAKFFKGGWFYPGDVGILSAAGVLRIVGRTSELMNLGGKKIAPEMVEDIVRTYAEVRDVAAFAVPSELGVDELWVAIVKSELFDSAAFEAALQGKISGRMKTAFVSSIPRNEMGKIRRETLRQSVVAAQAPKPPTLN